MVAIGYHCLLPYIYIYTHTYIYIYISVNSCPVKKMPHALNAERYVWLDIVVFTSSLCGPLIHIHCYICMMLRRRKKQCLALTTYAVLFENFIHSMDLSEFLFT